VSRLDINTPRGQESLLQEQDMIQLIHAAYDGIELLQTPKDKPADVDGFISRQGEIIGVYEAKCRDMTRDQLAEFSYEWLITFDKLQKGEIGRAHV